MYKVTTGIVNKYPPGETPFDDNDATINDVIAWRLERRLRAIALGLVEEDAEKLGENDRATQLHVYNKFNTDYVSLLGDVAAIVKYGVIHEHHSDFAPSLADEYLQAALYHLLDPNKIQ